MFSWLDALFVSGDWAPVRRLAGDDLSFNVTSIASVPARPSRVHRTSQVARVPSC